MEEHHRTYLFRIRVRKPAESIDADKRLQKAMAHRREESRNRRSSLVRYALDVRLTCEFICPFDFDSLWSCGGPWRGSIIRATVKLLSPASTAFPRTNRWKLGYDLVERQGADTLRNAELGPVWHKLCLSSSGLSVGTGQVACTQFNSCLGLEFNCKVF